MNRHQWNFEYDAKVLLDASRKKLNFHQERLDWWENKKKEVMGKIKEEGLEIDESVAIGYTNSARNTTVNIRNDLLVDLNECTSKITEHKAKVKDYDAWCQVLESQNFQTFQLHQEDWLFFFGR